MSNELLRQISELLFGAEWQTPLARELDVAERTIRRWAAGSNEVPAGVWRDLLLRLERLHGLVPRVMAQVRNLIAGQSALLEEWKSLIADVREAGLSIFATANVPITESGFADEKVVALMLLARTLSNLRGAALLLQARQIVEARTLARSALENLYWIVGLAEEGQSFVRKMVDDDMSRRRALGQNIFATEIALDEEIGERTRTFLREGKPRFENAKSLLPKQVARIRRDFEKTYIFYGQLSSDAAHPSTTALCRYIVPQSHPEGGGIDVDPVVSDEELAETCEFLCMASIGVCVAANQIIGGTAGGEALSNVADRHANLSNRTKGDRVLSERYRDMEIRGGDRAKLDEFIPKLIEAMPPGWTRDQIREKHVNRNLAAGPLDATAAVLFHTPARSGRPAAHLGLVREAGRYSVANVTPDRVGGDRFTPGQYNSILEEFRAICAPVAIALGLEVHVTSGKIEGHGPNHR